MKQLMQVTYKFGVSAVQHLIQVLPTGRYYQFNMVAHSLRKLGFAILHHMSTSRCVVPRTGYKDDKPKYSNP